MTPEEALAFLPYEQRFAVGERVPGEEISSIENSWWIAHPERGLAFAREAGGQSKRYCSPQCNVNQDVARVIQQKYYPSLQLRFEPIVYVRRTIGGAYLIPTGALA